MNYSETPCRSTGALFQSNDFIFYDNSAPLEPFLFATNPRTQKIGIH